MSPADGYSPRPLAIPARAPDLAKPTPVTPAPRPILVQPRASAPPPRAPAASPRKIAHVAAGPVISVNTVYVDDVAYDPLYVDPLGAVLIAEAVEEIIAPPVFEQVYVEPVVYADPIVYDDPVVYDSTPSYDDFSGGGGDFGGGGDDGGW